jgi:hypothetical protein
LDLHRRGIELHFPLQVSSSSKQARRIRSPSSMSVSAMAYRPLKLPGGLMLKLILLFMRLRPAMSSSGRRPCCSGMVANSKEEGTT